MGSSRLTAGGILLWMGIVSLSAALGAVITLVLIVTPKDRAGGPLLQQALEPMISQLGISDENSTLEGGELALNDDLEAHPGTEARFIVRFADSVQAGKALYVFRENRERGTEIFNEWAATQERFKGFELKTLTPSGEAVLAYHMTSSRAPDEARLKQLTRQLSDAPEVVYADPGPFTMRASAKS